MMDERMAHPTGRRGTCPECLTDVAEVGTKEVPWIATHHRKGRLCGGSYLRGERLLAVYDVASAEGRGT